MAWQLRTRRKPRRWLTFLVTAAALFTVTGFFVLPPIVKSQLERRLAEALHRSVSVGLVKINPYTLAVTVENLEIRDRDGRSVFLAWDRLYVNFEVLSFVSAQWRFREIALEGPRARVVVNPDGSLNFSDLLNQTPPAQTANQPATATKAVRIGRLALSGAKLDFVDRSRVQPFATTLGPVGFAVTEFHTVGGEQAPYRFEAVTELGERFAWRGWLLAAPFRSGGELAVTDLALAKYKPYYADRLGVDVAAGKLSVRGRYEVNFGDKNRVLRLVDGAVALRDLKLVERATGLPAVELPAVDVSGVSADGLTLQAAVAQVSVQGGRLKVRRELNGSLNLANFVPPPPAAASAAPAPQPGDPALGFTVAEIALKDLAVDFQDLSAPRPAVLGLDGLTATIRNFTLADGAKMPVTLAFAWRPQGTFRLGGEVGLTPLSAALELEVGAFDLLPLSPYLEQHVNARLTQGALSLKGRADLTPPVAPATAPGASFTGDVKLTQVGLVDGTRSEDLAGLAGLSLNGLQVTTAPSLKVALAEVVIAEPYARVVVEKDRSLNLARVVPPAAPGPATAPAGPVAPPDVTVARVRVENGQVTFADRSLAPEVRLGITQLSGDLTDLSSAQPGRGALDLKAEVNGGRLAVSGRIDPLAANPFADAKLELRGLDLVAFSPYAGKYAGYELARGRLTAALEAKLADRRLDLGNVVTLDQFTFGTATPGPDATKLPVRLGVALLKDTQGRIVIDLPVQGSLDDPEFRVGRVVLRTVLNLLTKAAVSPFTLLGSMFGGGGEELGWQEFAPGDATLSEPARAKLDTLVKALAARPGLAVDIEGGVDPAADVHALKQARARDAIRRQIWEERHALDPNLPPPAQLAVAPEEFAAAVKREFDRQFPPGTEFGTPLPPPPVIPPPVSTKRTGFLAQIVDSFTGRSIRERKALQAEQKRIHEEYVRQAEAAAAVGRPLDEMLGRLAERTEVTPDDLQALGAARAQAVRDYLAGPGAVAPDRLFLTKGVPERPAGPRVQLRLQ